MSAAVVAERSGSTTRCTTLRSAPPISLRQTPGALFLVASGAGPVGGDDLALSLDVHDGAALLVRSAGAQLVLPGPGGEPSRLTVRAWVRGLLVWRPEPTVLVAGCAHTSSVHLDLAEGASVEWAETVVLGRHGEPSGSMLQRIVVDRAGRPLLRNEVPLGPRWPGSAGPAGTDGARLVCSTLFVGRARPEEPDDGAVLELAEDAWLVTRLAGGDARHPIGGSAAGGPRLPKARQCTGTPPELDP